MFQQLSSSLCYNSMLLLLKNTIFSSLSGSTLSSIARNKKKFRALQLAYTLWSCQMLVVGSQAMSAVAQIRESVAGPPTAGVDASNRPKTLVGLQAVPDSTTSGTFPVNEEDMSPAARSGRFQANRVRRKSKSKPPESTNAAPRASAPREPSAAPQPAPTPQQAPASAEGNPRTPVPRAFEPPASTTPLCMSPRATRKA